jgi:hypothetical protein
MPITPGEPGADRRLRVFLCHSSGDKPAVRDLYRRLQADGFAPWLDEQELLPGQDWREEIPAAVRACEVVIVCLSQKSVSKEGYLQKEIREALYAAEEKPEGTIFIVPLRLEEVDVPRRLSQWQWADLFHESGYQRLLLALTARANDLGITVVSEAERPRKSSEAELKAREEETQRQAERERKERERAEGERLTAAKEAEAKRRAQEQVKRRAREAKEAEKVPAGAAEVERRAKERRPTPPTQPHPRVDGSVSGKTRKPPVAALVVAAIAVVVVTAAAVVWWLSRPKPGRLTITADVEKAQVAISGPVQGACVTPCPDYMLPAGNYRIVGTKPGYPSVELNTAVAAGQAGSINLPFESPAAGAPPSGTLAVTANVGGAQVTINPQSQPGCVTPCKLQIPPGGYRVGALKPGYRGNEQNVTVAASQVVSVNLQLSALNPNLPPPPHPGPSLANSVERGESDLRNGQFDSAITTFRKVISQGPSGTEKAQAYRDLCLALGPSKK